MDGEWEITLLTLIESTLYIMDTIDQNDIIPRLTSIGSKVSEPLTQLIYFNWIRLSQINNSSISPNHISHIENEFKNPNFEMIAILILRILGDYYYDTGQLSKGEQYYKYLLEASPAYSWNANYDLMLAQIGMAKIATLKGDYFAALTFYSFARQFFSKAGDQKIIAESQKEMHKISLLSISQQLQTALYQVNHGNKSVNTFLILLEGMQNAIDILIKVEGSFREKVIFILKPLLTSTLYLSELNHEKINNFYSDPLDFDFMKIIIERLTNSIPDQNLISQAIDLIDKSSYKDTKLIESISLFYKDGRHIGDFDIRDGRIHVIDSSPEHSLFTSAMSAVNMMITEATHSDGMVDEIKVGSKSVMFENGNWVTLAIIARSSNPSLKKIMEKVVKDLEEKLSGYLENWDGNLSIFQDINILFDPLTFFANDNSTNN